MTPTNQELYRIHWRARSTGATGNGTMGFPQDEAQRYADALNKEARVTNSTLEHWIEPEATEAAPK